MSRGSALIETVVIGFAVVLLAVQALVTIGRMSAAGAAAAEAARYAATLAARTGSLDDARREARRIVPEATVAIDRTAGTVVVAVSIDVPVLGPEGSPASMTVTGRATATEGRYRSGP